ncbi:Vacuolar protein sorting-associated protein 11-like protein [Aphelenchoides besseyi]|nr:Vacuolar protein sorting-associated protein 11-like protein [Aphelenchoides besseyi]
MLSRSDLNIQSWTQGDDFVLLAEERGMIFKLSRDLQLQIWRAYGHSLNGITLIQRFLFTVGEEEDNSGPLLKMWDLKRWERDEPFCKVISRLTVGKSKLPTPTAVSISVGADLSLVTVGLEDSTVLYHHGDLRTDRQFKWRVLREGLNAPSDGQTIGIAVASLPSCSVVFLICENSIQSFLLESGVMIRKVVHDAKGCEKNCWYFVQSTNTLVVASREMVHFYDVHNCIEVGNEKGRCHALGRGSSKLQLIAHGPHISLLTQRSAVIATNDSSTMCILNVYDVEFHYIAFQCPIPSVCKMFLLDGEICLIGADGVMNKIVEKSLNDKLEGLIKKSLFDVAIGLAKRHNFTDLQSIYVKYGDYLYGKGDYANAMEQYVETIGKVEPSFVIKKFLDGARIRQLCQYLESLHEKKLANGEHSTLLLGAYIKLGAKEQIGILLGKMVDFNQFNLDKAIKTLRSNADFSEVALRLAYQHGRYDTYLSILFEDLDRHSDAFKFVSQQPTEKMCDYLERYGQILMNNDPTAVTELLQRTLKEKPELCKPLMPILISRPDCLESIFSDSDGQLIVPSDPQLCITLLEHRLSKLAKEKKVGSCKKSFEFKCQRVNQSHLNELCQLVVSENANEAVKFGRQFDVPALVIYAYRKLKKTEDLMRFLLHEGDVQQIVEMCDERVLKDMWIELVAHVSRKKDLSTSDLMILLEKAKTSKFLHPLVILEILARNDHLKVADIKDYIVNWLNEQNEIASSTPIIKIKENEKQIVENEAEIERLEKQNDELENGSVGGDRGNVQVFQTSKCSACDSSLQVPAIHFLCNHSYHQHCFESWRDGKDTCPACTTTQSSEQQPTAQLRAISHADFQQELQNTSSAMRLISDYIAMGVFQSDNKK